MDHGNEIPSRLVHGHKHGRLYFEMLSIAINFLVEKRLSLSFGAGKMKFHYCRTPRRKSFWPLP